MIGYAILWWLANFSLQYKFRHCTNKPNHLASNILAQINTYLFILTSDVELFLSYQLYDIINAIYKRDKLIIAHHVISYYLLNLQYERENIILITWYFELANVLMHYYKISQLMHFTKVGKKIIAVMVMTISIPLWLVFRMLIPLSIAWNFTYGHLQIASVLFFAAHVWWIKGMIRVLHKNLYD